VNHELPKGWIVSTIKNVSGICEQKVPDDDEQFLYVDIGSIDRDLKRIASPQSIKGRDAPSRARKCISTGDVLVSLTRPNLNAVALVTPDFDGQVASTGFEVLRPVLVDSRYLFYLVRTRDFIEKISGLTQGALYPAAKSADVREYQFPLAPLSEQIRIADMLDRVLARVNAAQSRLDKIPALIKRFRQSVLAAATSGELTQEWRDMHNIDPTYVTLGDAGVVIKTGPFGSALHKEEYIHGGIPVINPMHIKDGEIAPSSDMTITESKFDELNAWHLQEGDIVIGRRGEMGRAAEVPKHSGSMLCGTGSMIIRSEPERILPAFLCLVLRSPNAIRYFEGNAIGSTMVNLNQKVIKNLPFHYPSLDEQKEIVRRVESLFAIADNVEKQYQDARARTDRLTQAILAKAFRGELVPQNPDDEPAEALLQHIQQQRAEQATAGKRGKARKVSG